MADVTLLVAEVAELKSELSRLNKHRFIEIHNSVPRLIAYQFVRGLAFGLGTVVGATILVSVLGYLLSSVNFIPIIGEWAAEIVLMMDQN